MEIVSQVAVPLRLLFQWRTDLSEEVTGFLPEQVSGTAGVPQIAADLLQHHISAAPGPGCVKIAQLGGTDAFAAAEFLIRWNRAPVISVEPGAPFRS
jgi:hypothetical protein